MIELSYFIERIHVVSHGMHRLGIKTSCIPRFFKGMLLYPTYPLTLAMQSRCTQYFCLWQVVSESFSFTMLAACTPAKPL